LKELAFAASLVATAFAGFPALAEKLPEPDTWFTSRSQLAQQTGEGIYAAVCAGCHMPSGEGAVGAGFYPALADNENLEFPDYAIAVTLNGLRAMPPLGGILDDDQVAAVITYIRTRFGNDYQDPVGSEQVGQFR
jgi:mono/diheme cytochrome c family protein